MTDLLNYMVVGKESIVWVSESQLESFYSGQYVMYRGREGLLRYVHR